MRKILKNKKEEFDKHFLAKAIELDREVENLWKSILTKEKIENILKYREDFDKISFENTIMDRYEDFECSKNVVFGFSLTAYSDNINMLRIKENGDIEYYVANLQLCKNNNRDMLNPVKNRDEKDINIEELVKRQMEYLREKQNFLTFLREEGKETFEKYYFLFEDEWKEKKLYKEISYIEKSIKEMENMG